MLSLEDRIYAAYSAMMMARLDCVPQEQQQQQIAGVTGAIVAAGVIGAGASIYAGDQASKSATAQANGQNTANLNASEVAAQEQQQTNEQNFNYYQQSRGSNGSAVLPLYMQNPGGGMFEQSLGKDLVSAYNQTAVPLSTFQSAASTVAPAQAGAEQFTNDIFGGGITNKLLAEAAPVQAARISGARSSALDALNKTLAAIDAAQAGKGFSGDSFGNRALAFQGEKAAGDAISGANLTNLGENQQIENYGNVTLPSQNLNLPLAMGSQANQFAFLPQSGYLNSIQSRTAPLSFVRIGQGAPFQNQPLQTPPPQVVPNKTSTGQLVGQGISSLAGTALSAYTAGAGGSSGGGSTDFANGPGGYNTPGISAPVLSYANGSALAGYNASGGGGGGITAPSLW